MAQPMPNGKVDGGEHHRVVTGFRHPRDAWLSQAKLPSGESITVAIYLHRHARRAKRNEHRLAIVQTHHLVTRSEDAWGSREAADVARGAPPMSPGGMLENLVGSIRPPAPAGNAATASNGSNGGNGGHG